MEAIAITGGSGMLGRALIARLHETARLTAFSRSEKAQLPLRAAYPSVRFLVGDICDPAFLARTFQDQDVVIHAAALKHVPISESEPTEYTRVNVVGSLNVAAAATSAGARVVAISTDKATDPANVYGYSKLLMERVMSEHGFVSVRYGNVFGSDGSVIHVWRRQLDATGEITVTDPEMTRFFFRVEDAVDEVCWAADHGPPGRVVVPRLRSVALMDLARAFIQAAGRGTIAVAGQRPGEKRHEALLSAREGERAELVDGRCILGSEPASQALPAWTSDAAERIDVDELRTWIDELRSNQEAA